QNGSIDGILHNVTLVAAYNTAGVIPTIGFQVSSNPLTEGGYNFTNTATAPPPVGGVNGGPSTGVIRDPNGGNTVVPPPSLDNHSVVTGYNPTTHTYSTNQFAGAPDGSRTWVSYDLGNMDHFTANNVADFSCPQGGISTCTPAPNATGAIFAYDLT